VDHAFHRHFRFSLRIFISSAGIATDNGINVATNANAVALMIEGATISNNLRGIITTGAGANTRIGCSVISNNGTAVSA
jgi:hypothetical protein